MNTTQIELQAIRRGVQVDKDGHAFYYKCAPFTVFVGSWFLALKRRRLQWEFFTPIADGVSRAELYLALSGILNDASLPKEELVVAKRELSEALSAFAQQARIPESQLAHPQIERPAVPAERLH